MPQETEATRVPINSPCLSLISSDPVETLHAARCVLIFVNEVTDGLTKNVLSDGAAIGLHTILDCASEAIGDAMEKLQANKGGNHDAH